LLRQIRPVLFRQGQHFNHFFSSDAHAARISASAGFLASLKKRIVTISPTPPLASHNPGVVRRQRKGLS
jgi:hypothetical protein